MQFGFQFWNHSVRSQKCCYHISVVVARFLFSAVWKCTTEFYWPKSLTSFVCHAMVLSGCYIGYNLKAAAFWVFNRNFSIGWKLQCFAISTLKMQRNAVNACIKRSSHHSLKFRKSYEFVLRSFVNERRPFLPLSWNRFNAVHVFLHKCWSDFCYQFFFVMSDVRCLL